MSTFEDSESVVWTITEPTESNEKIKIAGNDGGGERAKWIGGIATSTTHGKIKLYGATWEEESPPKGGNVFNGKLQLVGSEKGYQNPGDYKDWNGATLDHCAGERGKSQDRPTCSTMDALTNCEIIKNMFSTSEKCSSNEIKLEFHNMYFTWTPPHEKKVTLKLEQLWDFGDPKNKALLIRLAPMLWRPPGTKGGRKRRRKTKRKRKRKSKRKTKRKSKRRRKRKSKRRR
tara:strand:- start:32 stop:721 length:690 start_codon:yes stop_codon:yes gene_type:complete